MMRKTFATALTSGAVAFLLAMFLFADGTGATSSGFIGVVLKEIGAVCRDSTTQWLVVSCLAAYFVFFWVMEQRRRSGLPSLGFKNPTIWLAALVLLALLRYALAYDQVSKSMQIPVLLAAIVFGRGVATWARWRSADVDRRAVLFIFSLVGLLAALALWQPGKASAFQYHGLSRWSGVWDNPNLYGLLMGSGLILAVGLAIRAWQGAGGKPWNVLGSILFLLAAMLTGYGLFKSYSRGAWLATLAGFIYLVFQTVKASRFSIWFRRNRLSLAWLAASLALLVFWQFRFSETPAAQRLFSAANANDFSWRNRVTAWGGAVRMMADRPLAGFGWGQVEPAYVQKYCPPRLNEGAAIEMNDYLMIGISAGIPALLCFIAYLWFSIRKNSTDLKFPPAGPLPAPSIFTIGRSGSIVLLTGFWFDGGLFKLPVATVFWSLLELARLESFTPPPEVLVQKAAANAAGSQAAFVRKRGAWENGLRRLAGFLAVLAAVQTTVYLGTPLFPVSDATLAIAQKCLIPPKETKDFEFLSTNTIWSGQKLKILLDHVELAGYDRELINWQLNDKMYRDFVLSPVITGKPGEQLDWRRPLWEEFYPRIRHETSPAGAAKVVVRHLDERVTLTDLPGLPHDAPDIWRRQITDQPGFEIICVAALRSVGVPARLQSGQAEYWDGNQWQAAPDQP